MILYVDPWQCTVWVMWMFGLWRHVSITIFFLMVQQPLTGQSFLIIEATWSHSFRHTTIGRIPLDECPDRRWDQYLTTRNTNMRETSTPPRGIRTHNSSNLWPQTHALGRADTGIGNVVIHPHSAELPPFTVYWYFKVLSWEGKSVYRMQK
jgi:hypothetical protein